MIENKYLKKAVEYKVGKFLGESLTSEDLLNVEELSLSNVSFSGEKRNIDLLELKKLPNIRKLDLQYFNIDTETISMINMFRKLDSLQLASCDFSSNEVLRNIALRSLVFNSCRIKDYSKIFAPQILTVINAKNIRLDDLQGIENVEVLNLQNSIVKGTNRTLECKKLRKLNLDGSILDNEEIIASLPKEVEISKKDKYLPVR